MKDILKKFRRPLLIGLTIGIFLAFSTILVKFSINGRFSPGTVVANQDISYMSLSEAKTKLNAATEKFSKSKMKINLDAQSATFSPDDLGIQILVNDTLNTLEKIDARKVTLLNWIFSTGAHKEVHPLIIQLDYKKAEAALEQAFLLAEKSPRNAIFYFEKGKKLTVMPEKSGIVADTNTLLGELKNSAENLQIKDLILTSSQKSPAITATILEEARPKIEASLRQKINLLDPIYSDDWHFSLSQHLDWVTFTPKQEITLPFTGQILKSDNWNLSLANNFAKTENYIAIEIDPKKLNEFVDAELSKWLDIPVENVNIYTDKDSKVIIEGRGRDGRMVQRDHLKKAIELAVESNISDVPIPVITLAPKITVSDDLASLGIKDRLSVGHTSYYGSPPNRIYNINVGSSKFNGLLIKPDEEFSFNEHLGNVDAISGYRKELVIKPEGTIPEYGGGICQLSTTFYRAILFAGLPVTERREHSYAVTYYSQILGHGLDATIYLGSQDLKFKNDTGHNILVQTFVDNDAELYVIFYGTSDGRSVKMDGPYISANTSAGKPIYIASPDISSGRSKQTEKAHNGFKALWYRYITFADGTTKTETINSSYRAIPAKILVAPDSPELTTPSL
ncbi:MAG: VanW family protein [Candidatus Gracilibacteria bacterium]